MRLKGSIIDSDEFGPVITCAYDSDDTKFLEMLRSVGLTSSGKDYEVDENLRIYADGNKLIIERA